MEKGKTTKEKRKTVSERDVLPTIWDSTKWMEATIEFNREILGTVSKEPEMQRQFISSKIPDLAAEDQEKKEVATNLLEDEVRTAQGTIEGEEEDKEKPPTGFHKDQNGVFILDYMFKGFLKKAAVTVGQYTYQVPACMSKVADYVFVYPRKIYLTNPDGTTISEPKETLTRPLVGMTKRGKTISIASSELIPDGTRATIRISMLKHPDITKKLILGLMEYGMVQGLGQWRNAGYGRFHVVEGSVRDLYCDPNGNEIILPEKTEE